MKPVLYLLILFLGVPVSLANNQNPSVLPPESNGDSHIHDDDKCAVSAYFFQRGNIPVFLSNEHGASKSQIIAGVPLRSGRRVKKFVAKSDLHTAEITLKVAQEFERLTGKKPYLLIAKIHRSQIDFNRSEHLSYEHPYLKPCYDDFHRVARVIVDEIRQRWEQGYLLDLHGQSKYPGYLIRGTQNGLTVYQLRRQEGNNVYQRGLGLFGQLESIGYQVMPLYPQPETVYRGGYMVETYGSHNSDGIDAVQFEIGKYYRKGLIVRRKLILDLAGVLSKRMNVIINQ